MPEPRLKFVPVRSTGKTFIWNILNGQVWLGEVRWYAPWRRYCFYPKAGTIFDASCLREIVWFIDQQMQARKDRT